MSEQANTMKWASIEGVIAEIFGPTARLTDLDQLDFVRTLASLNAFRNKLFLHPVQASFKIDGTNLGLDSEGRVYGRNQMVDHAAESYQKTSLKDVRQVDVGEVKDRILRAVLTQQTPPNFLDCVDGRVETLEALDAIDRFVLYGELACNKAIYDYACSGAAGGWLIFGLIVKVKGVGKGGSEDGTDQGEEGGTGDQDGAEEKTEKLTHLQKSARRLAELFRKAGFAVHTRSQSNSDEDGCVRVSVNARFRQVGRAWREWASAVDGRERRTRVKGRNWSVCSTPE